MLVVTLPETNRKRRRFVSFREDIPFVKVDEVDSGGWLVVEPTPLKNMRKSNWIISPGRDGKKYVKP